MEIRTVASGVRYKESLLLPGQHSSSSGLSTAPEHRWNLESPKGSQARVHLALASLFNPPDRAGFDSNELIIPLVSEIPSGSVWVIKLLHLFEDYYTTMLNGMFISALWLTVSSLLDYHTQSW